MDRITKSLLDESSAEHDLSSLAEDKRFEHFAALLTVGRFVSEALDTTDVVIGASGDSGIDAIAIIANGALIENSSEIDELAERNGYLDVTFVFVQAERSSAFETAKIGQFSFGVQDFFKEKPSLPRGRDVIELANIMSAVYKQSSKFKRGNPVCRMYYVTTGTWTGDAALEARRKAAIDDLTALRIFRTVEFQPVDAEGIQRLYRESRNSVSREFEFAQKTVIPTIEGVTEAYVGLLPAREFLRLIEDESGEMLKGIFYDNVRDWQDFNAVNSEMRSTLESKNTRARFALMNNGVTVIAKTMRTTANRFYIEDYQVVNGCQTSHVIHDQRASIDDSVMIPLRLIATQDDEIIGSIVKATNRQTEVREEQLLALSDFQKKLEAYFNAFEEGQRLYYERRSRQYSNAGGIEKTRIVTPGGLIRAYASMFLEEPHRATRSYRRILDRVGVDLFAEGDKLEPYYLAALAAYRLEYLFRNQALHGSLRAARYEILLAVRLLEMPSPLPRMNSHDMERLCKQLSAKLWDAGEAEQIFAKASTMVLKAANGDLDAASLRTEPFTDALKAFSTPPRRPPVKRTRLN
ncbi:AIPR family protein [Variovorax sp. EBFNA2]|uniref:AIPR family protein n=1 Tax=Variovorax sp. EBFNA2 TaxID=3342097 RepID=UPI0029C0A360|nr:AIPR family protein [Variovorax boronicumulans]WPG35312.1 AIPR family protein [Variovorax boronicumulans]